MEPIFLLESLCFSYLLKRWIDVGSEVGSGLESKMAFFKKKGIEIGFGVSGVEKSTLPFS